jgi:hypothetical protein
MKRQVRRFPPHQNGKVISIVVTLGMLPLFLVSILPPLLLMPATESGGIPVGLPFFLALLLPLLYLIFTYLSVCFGCWLYNLLFHHIGGVELEFLDEQP